MDCSPQGSFVYEILQSRILEWVVMPSSRAYSLPRDQSCVSYVSCIGRGFFTTSATWAAWSNVLPGGSDCKESACNTRDLGSIPGLWRSLGEGNRNPLRYSCLQNPMDGRPGRLQSMGSQRVGHNWATNTFFHHSLRGLLRSEVSKHHAGLTSPGVLKLSHQNVWLWKPLDLYSREPDGCKKLGLYSSRFHIKSHMLQVPVERQLVERSMGHTGGLKEFPR